MQNNTSSQSAKRVHQHLTQLIKQKFGVFLEVEHVRFNNDGSNRTPRAITVVAAFKNLEDARNLRNAIAIGRAVCARDDQFVRAEGLAVALRRLYRELSNKEKV